ncbi:hypothetical protein WISP_24425 [Willisornis vidua]|uniref:Uncharacterized protein n=1 Tax=Willisornis vidua TaxID=1566151 RepID=A0ABQ9DM59_9PASS|nr:hypothetical protein WISP_24425 [Willisornis vidua]
MQNSTLWEGLMLDSFMENCLLWEGPHAGALEEGEEEGAAEKCDDLTAIPVPQPPAPLQDKEMNDRATLVGTWCPAKVNITVI